MFRTNLRLRPLLLGLCVVLLDCATLDDVPAKSCGNGVVDANEDCDTFPNNPSDTSHARCGGPSEGEFACHLRCGAQADGSKPTCPDGWGCSVTGICRAPTLNFSGPPVGPFSGGANQLAVGDFDGDGRQDLIGFGIRNATTNASRLRVHYFDDNGALTNVAVLPRQGVAPAVFDHDHDGRADIAYGIAAVPPNPGQLAVVSGLADKTFLPVVFASTSLADTEASVGFVYPRPDIELPTGDLNAVLAITRSTPTTASLVSIQAELSGNDRLAMPLPIGPEAIRGLMVWGRMFPGNADSTCGELVFPMQPDGGSTATLFVVSPCTPRVDTKTPKSMWNSDIQAAIQTFALDTSLAADSRGALIADVNDDGSLDVLIDTMNGPYVAYGERSGKTLSPPRKWTPDLVSPSGQSTAAAMPLAAGDIDLDGKTDFVFTSSLALTTPPLAASNVADAGAEGGADGGMDAGTTSNPDGQFFVKDVPIQPWNEAAIGHFNADPYPDLVTAKTGSPDLVVFLGGPDGVTMTTVTTDGRVEKIAKGDYDGDHIEDLAITESTANVGTSDLSIAYGQPFGGLEPRTRIGSVDTPKGFLAVLNGSGPANLGLFAYAKTLNLQKTYHTTSLTLLQGSGDRQPIAPLLFVEPLSCVRTTDPCMPGRPILPAGTSRFWNPVGVAAGHFKSADNSAVLAYASGTPTPKSPLPLGAWVADADPNVPGGLDAPVERQILEGTVDVVDTSSGSARLATATGNVDSADKNGLAKIVALTNAPGSPDALLLVVDPSVKGVMPPFTLLKGLRVAAGAQLSLVDLDGDGLLDAVATFGEAPDTQIYALLNNGKGTFATPGIKLTFAADDPALAGVGSPVAFAPINLHGAPATGGSAQTKGLAVLTSHSVVLVTLRADKQGFDAMSLGTDFGNAVGIAAGDFNGDGLDDIAVADGSINILLQKLRKEDK